MTIFRDAIAALNGQEATVLIGGEPVLVTVTLVNDDLVKLKLAAPLRGVNELAVQIDTLQVVLA